MKRLTINKFRETRPNEGESPDDVMICSSAPAVISIDKIVSKELDDNEDLTSTWIISDASEDRDGDVISPNGWLLDSYRNGGSVLWGHDPDVVVAKPLITWLENNQLKCRAEFMPKEMNPFSYMTFQMASKGFVRGASVGFRALEWKYNEERGSMAIDFVKQELMEWSVTPIPSNPNALVEAKSMGVELDPLKGWLEQVLDNDSPKAMISRAKAEKLYSIVKEVDGKNAKTVVAPEPVKSASNELDQKVDKLFDMVNKLYDRLNSPLDSQGEGELLGAVDKTAVDINTDDSTDGCGCDGQEKLTDEQKALSTLENLSDEERQAYVNQACQDILERMAERERLYQLGLIIDEEN